MQLRFRTTADAHEKIATRWNLKLGPLVAQTNRARVYKVDAAEGACALKIYKEVGAAGEGAAIRFLRDVSGPFAVKVHRQSVWQAAVLMEWIDGPSLQDLIANNQEERAVSELAQAAAGVQQSTFKFPFMYQRLVTKHRTVLSASKQDPIRTQEVPELRQSIDLLNHLVATTQHERIIHGDLTFANVISSANGPRIIDPKGFRADPAIEFGKALVFPMRGATPEALVARARRRGPVMAKAIEVPVKRVFQWAAVSVAVDTFRIKKDGSYNATMIPFVRALLDLAKEN